MKSQFLALAIDKPTLEMVKAIKKVFGPKGILNSEKIFVRVLRIILAKPGSSEVGALTCITPSQKDGNYHIYTERLK
jgi:hypothetical protein